MAPIKGKFLCKDIQATHTLAQQCAENLQEGTIVALEGPLGSGKTTFVKAILSALGFAKNTIKSPTYSYVNIYNRPKGLCPIYHFDLYRLASHTQFVALGFHEYLEQQGICFIEWADKIFSFLPEEKTLHITFQYQSDDQRIIEISNV